MVEMNQGNMTYLDSLSVYAIRAIRSLFVNIGCTSSTTHSSLAIRSTTQRGLFCARAHKSKAVPGSSFHGSVRLSTQQSSRVFLRLAP
jgi:hypothetical protein